MLKGVDGWVHTQRFKESMANNLRRPADDWPFKDSMADDLKSLDADLRSLYG